MKRLCLSPLVLSGLFLVIFIISCGKQGATGPAGATGATGPAGPAGPKGDSSAGTVIYSDWMDVNFLPDTIIRAGGKIDTIGYYAIISVPKLTTAMLNNSDVKVYINTSDITNPLIYPLPYSGTSGLNIELSAYAQNIQLYSNGQVSTVTSNGKKIQQYRYMIVPGNTKASTGSNVKWSDYTAVKGYLGLND
ncbi:MAG TPA: collagen-like protein [Puia sp.]|nr:collagen-like protein [Puia sp.]